MTSVTFFVTLLALNAICWFPLVESRSRSKSKNKFKKLFEEGRIRLIGGRRPYMGTVLINHNGYWGAICDQWWGINDATVACKQLGFLKAVKAKKRSVFGHGRKRMWMTRMRCSGREARLAECPFAGWNRHTRHRCPGQFRSAGVICVASRPTTTTTTAKTTSTTPTTTTSTSTTTTTATTTTTTTTPTTTKLPPISKLEMAIAAWAANRKAGDEPYQPEIMIDDWNMDSENKTDISSTQNNASMVLYQDADSDNITSQNNASKTSLKEKPLPTKKGKESDKDSAMKLLADAPRRFQDLELRITGGRYKWEGHLQIREKNGQWGTLCGDHWTMKEAIVSCNQIGEFGKAKQALTYSYFGGRSHSKPFYRIKCKGNEAKLSDCEITERNEENRCSKSTSVAGIVCSKHLPDLVPNIRALQDSVRLQDQPLYYLRCSMEENCLAHSAYVIRNTSRSWRNKQRRLLRFSTVVHNRGLSDFRPFLPRQQWEWHACHMHYHSMEVFAHYDIMNAEGVRLAEGSKASFCLEDTTCDKGVKPKYNCRGFSDQGLSVNCSDNYMYDIDCQWIDITDIKPGDYTFLMEVNPSMLVAESNYTNNVISCHLNYNGYFAFLRNCHYEDLVGYRRPIKMPDLE